MSFKKVEINLTLKGALLAIVHRLFPERIPTVAEYAQENGVATSTFARAADWLWGFLPGLFRRRRPGPASPEREEPDPAREGALGKLKDLRLWLQTQSQTPVNACYDGEAKRRIAAVAQEIRLAGLLSYEEIAAALGLDKRQLHRIRKQVEEAGAAAPQKESRRPKTTARLAPQIRILIRRIEASAPTKDPYGPLDIKHILEKNYVAALQKYHGSATISATTVSKYMAPGKEEEPWEHPRGSYEYPEPFQVVALDTSYFKLFGITFYLITVFEMAGRLNLRTRVFLQENLTAVVTVLEEFLAAYPAVEVAVIDRGRPYLNEEVKSLLESHGRFRLVCPPATPTAKAACERHFETLKAVLRPALDTALPEDPGWCPAQLTKCLELVIAVFSSLYHHIPQESIDGKSPAQRVAEFDPVRACAQQVALFQRALNAEPSDEYARHIHRLFQFPWDEAETVKTLRYFPTRVLRQLVDREKAVLGPPIAITIRKPLDYLAARARELRNKEQAALYAQQWEGAQAQREREERGRQEAEYEEQPERHVDGMLKTLVLSVRNGHGVSTTIGFMRTLLGRLAEKMGAFFLHELSRLEALVDQLTDNLHVRTTVRRILQELGTEVRPPVADYG